MKKIILLLIAIIFNTIFINASFAETFYIENYNVNLNVNKNKSVNVTEDIQVYFTSPSHGIFRTIPYKNATITNVGVNKEFSSSISNSKLTLKIGNPDIMVSGAQTYKINYNYNIYDTKNEFYFNIIGTEWPVEIKHVTFNVTMPKDFDFSKTGLSIGEYGTVGFIDRAFYSKEGNRLYGKTTESLKAGEGITLRIEVPEDYFTNAKKIKITKILTIIGIIVLTLNCFFTWFKYGKDEHIRPVVTFYPPKDINVVEAELVYKEDVSNNGLVALLIELAGKGYIQINDSPNDNNFSITKIKEYDGSNRIEKLFLNHLFADSKSSVSFKTLSTSSTFYQKCSKLLDLCNKKRNSLYEKTSIQFKNKLILTVSIIAIIYLTILSMCNYIAPQFSSCTAFCIPFILLGSIFLANANKNPILGIMAFYFLILPTTFILADLNCNLQNAPVTYLGIAGIIISSICLKQITKKKKRTQEILSQLLGLKKFLEVAEKHRLESLVAENPSYFYDILPYAYILGVSDKWIKKFENIMKTNPDWYTGSDFNSNQFHRFVSDMHSTTIPSFKNGGISRSSSSSSSRSGGGGHSGGGHGGGGGGSW